MPGDGAAWDRLGRARQWDFLNSDLPGAITDYKKAVEQDPGSAYYWMDLAGAYEAAGNNARAEDSYAQAKAVYPASAEVAFHYGNFLLRVGKYPEGYKEPQRAVRADPKLLPLAISRTWRSSGDVDQLLDQMLPADTEAYLKAVDFFASIRQADPALAVWHRLVSLRQPFPRQRAFPILDELIHEDRADARRMALGIVALVALALVAWVGAGKAMERFSSLNSHDVSFGRRVSMFRGAAHIFLDHPIKGSGWGTLVAVYPRYETAYDGRLVDHVHDDYIETLAETGLLGGLCGLWFLWLLVREARKSFGAEQRPFSRALHAGAIAAVGGLLLHSFVDFNLQIPANALLFLLMAYLATFPSLAPGSKIPRAGA